MAGRGSRFRGAGFNKPKPLIEVAGKPMLIRALKSIEGFTSVKPIIIALEEHQEQFKIDNILLESGIHNFELVLIPEVTEGQLSTVMAAQAYINPQKGLLIAPSDTYIGSDLAQEIAESKNSTEGIISVYNLPGNQWSFAKINEESYVVEVAEKVRISDNASTGLYYFSNTQKFFNYASKMIANSERSKGEFYVMPIYQKYIDDGAEIAISKAIEMWDMGTPEARLLYENHLLNE